MALTEPQNALRMRYMNAADLHMTMAKPFTEDQPTVLTAWAEVIEELIPTLPYVDEPNHPMADSVFDCAGALALYLALQRTGHDVDVHEFGPVMIDGLSSGPAGATPSHSFQDFADAGRASRQHAAPTEFVFDMYRGDGSDFVRAIDITSCAICHMCTPHGAMDLVPYMCSLDDAVSDQFDQGLRRTGTIALGTASCDFRFTGRDGDPLDLAQQYPTQIRTTDLG